MPQRHCRRRLSGPPNEPRDTRSSRLASSSHPAAATFRAGTPRAARTSTAIATATPRRDIRSSPGRSRRSRTSRSTSRAWSRCDPRHACASSTRVIRPIQGGGSGSRALRRDAVGPNSGETNEGPGWRLDPRVQPADGQPVHGYCGGRRSRCPVFVLPRWMDELIVFRLGCGGCRKGFVVCRPDYRGQGYCNDACRELEQAAIHRRATARHQRSDEGRRDHAAHQRASKARKRVESGAMTDVSRRKVASRAEWSAPDDPIPCAASAGT